MGQNAEFTRGFKEALDALGRQGDYEGKDWSEPYNFLSDGLMKLQTPDALPIPIRLNCPSCGMLHIDEGEFATKPHHTHSCQGCGMTWRPAVQATVGVQFLPGFKNQ